MNKLPLKLILLGTGTCVPDANRNSAGFLVTYRDQTILVDCGAGILRRIAETDVDFRNIDTICLTHFHPDHSSDLASFFLASKYTPGFKRTSPLTIIGPIGLTKFLQTLAELYGQWINASDFPIIIKEVKNDSIVLKSLTLFSAPMLHSSESIAYRFETSNGQSITYSGDTDYTPSLTKLAAQTDLLLIECSFPQQQKTEGHLTPGEVGKIAADSNAKKVVLTHMYPVFENIDPVQQVKNHYKGEVIVGKDLMFFQI